MPSYARPTHPPIRRLRALRMLEMVLQGKNYTEVAKAFNTSRMSVRRSMEYLDKEGLLSEAEDRILKELYPLALEVYKKHLQEQLSKQSDIEVSGARDVLKIPLKKAGMTKKDNSGELTLEEWVIRRKLRRAPEEDPLVIEHGPALRVDHLLDPPAEDAGRAGEGGDDDQREEL